jgi:hypothetical protein
MTQISSVPWDDTKSEQWAAGVLQAAGGFWKRGTSGSEKWIEIEVACPRCTHPGTRGVIYEEVPIGLTDKAPEYPKTKNVFCKCKEDHKGPPGKQGCGGWGAVAVVVAETPKGSQP